MTKEDTKAAAEVMRRAAEGEPLQYRYVGDTSGWGDCTTLPIWDWNRVEYRIKPTPREFWIRPEILPVDALTGAFVIIHEDADDRFRKPGFIKVREVLE